MVIHGAYPSGRSVQSCSCRRELLIHSLQALRGLNHEISPRGEGNVVSVEFNLMYRWHSTLSEHDTKWVEEKFRGLFPGKDLGKVFLNDATTRVN